MQNEIQGAVSVLDELGGPQNFGWSRQPDLFFDPALIWAPQRKLSESDRYIVFSPTHLVMFEIRDDGYLGNMAVSVVSMKDKRRSTQLVQTILPMGSYEMPPSSKSGSINYRHRKSSMDFVAMDGGVRLIRADLRNFGRHRNLRGELVLSEPAMAESLVTNLPWRGDKSSFRYSRRSPWYTVEGVVQFGTTEIVFTRGNAWGIFDWNRSVRPRSDVSYWAAACGAAACGAGASRLAGFSVGYGSVDSSVSTENAFFLDGRMHKLDQVTFHIPPANWLAPWRFTSNDNRLEMTFAPAQYRMDRSSFLFFSRARRQVCGSFSGTVILDDGEAVEFRDLTGFAERNKTRF